MRPYRFASLLLAATVASHCGEGGNPIGPSPTPTTAAATPEAARAYLDSLLEIMRRYSVNTATIDWDSVRAEVMAAGVERAVPDVSAGVAAALQLVGDDESYYVGRDGRTIGPPPFGGCGAAPSGALTVPDSIGYVRIGGCPCQTAAEATRFAESIQEAIRAADREGLAGWIVDFRGNGGGNMWPMIAGVGPVLGEGIIGWIIYNDREYEREYVAGGAQSFGEVFARVPSPYALHAPYPKVAVLTDGSVVSAGEAVVIFFKGRPRTRSFGTPTCGHQHLQLPFPLGDGATLFLVAGQHADRSRRRYGGALHPDEIIADPREPLDRAVTWLLGRE
jgi:hypothetical protein